ncbi:unnamed protein product [Urochloa decumbens]|uniref:non-specific serine/threonine protein kinase n=1 Tax=Urochloa decumbens TaxID=240449 RepID=A0ABC8ZY65_9POAL
MLLVAAVLLAAAAAQAQQLINGSLSIGQSLFVGQTLVSEQGIFVLGFFSNGDSTYLGIWYNYIKPKAIVWVANRDTPIKGGNGSLTLSISSLDLLDRRGSKVWPVATFDTNSPQAFLLDSGNLIINGTMPGTPNPTWQSFGEPCDTLLSGMRIGYGSSPTTQYTQLKSWKSVLDPSTGDYSIWLDPRRLPELLLSHGTALLYRTGPWNGQGFSGQPYLKATNKLAFNMTVSKDSAYYSFTALDRSVHWRFIVSPDGLAHRWYSNPSNDWVEYWHWPQNQCDSYAFCGPNAACHNDDCSCLQEFVPKSPSDWNQRNFTGPNIAIVVSISVVVALLAISAVIGFCYRRSRQKHLSLALDHDHGPGPKLAAPLEKNLDLHDIRVATNNFAEQNIIVSTRSRTIYKGTLPNFGDLALKRLNTEAGLEEIKNEVKMLARLDHPNIIRMPGSCIGNSEKVICYEYMPGGSVDEVLFAEDEKSAVPDWPSRLGIMQGICEGLLYLHDQFGIIHRDIDPSNILLSEDLIPKISDFGRATLHDQGQSEGNDENFEGTQYSAPELFYNKSYSVKSDVYSFGIVLLELVTGCKAASFRREDADDLPTYVRQHWTHGTADQLKDPRMGDAPRGEVERCIHIGVRCVQDDPTMRPTMSYIKNTLAAISPSL